MQTQTSTIEAIAGAIRRELGQGSDNANADWRVEVIPTQRGQWTWRVVGPATAPSAQLRRAAPTIGLLQRKLRLDH